MAGSFLGMGDPKPERGRGEAPVARPEPRTGGQQGGGQKLGVDPADPGSRKPMAAHEGEHFGIGRHTGAGQVREEVDQPRVAQRAEGDLADDGGVAQHPRGLEQGGERGIATAEVVDPDGGVDEDEAQGSAGLSRRQAGDGAGR